MVHLIRSYAKYSLDFLRHVRHPLFEQRFRKHLADTDPSNSTPLSFFRGLPDDYFFWIHTFSHNLGQKANDLVPHLPPAHIQRNWTGNSGEYTLREAFEFYRRIKIYALMFGRKPLEEMEVLDFGCGWGRIIRFFLREAPHQRLHGSDCWAEIVEFCRSSNKWCDFRINNPLPPCDFPAESLDLVYLYSVFSHLSEEAHSAWLAEFRRILKPGGLLVVTTRPRNFLKMLSAKRGERASKGLLKTVTAVEAFPDIRLALQAYDRGEFCFCATGGGGPLETSFYGEACIPENYVRGRWTGFEFLGAAEPGKYIDQNVFCCRKQT